MAIIIQDMSMPAQCWQCPFHFRLDNAHTACSRNPMENPIEDGDKRPKHCPLKEVHYITKDKAIQEIEEYIRKADNITSQDEEYIRGWKSALLVALEIVTKIGT